MSVPRVLDHPGLRRILAALLGAVFLYASVDKIAEPREFARIVYHYQILGPNPALGFVPANLFAVVLPWVEALLGALLVLGLWRREAAILAGSLLVLFLAAVGSALLRGLDIENCGCFSVSGAGRAAGWRLLAGDVALLAVSAVSAWAPSPSR